TRSLVLIAVHFASAAAAVVRAFVIAESCTAVGRTSAPCSRFITPANAALAALSDPDGGAGPPPPRPPPAPPAPRPPRPRPSAGGGGVGSSASSFLSSAASVSAVAPFARGRRLAT